MRSDSGKTDSIWVKTADVPPEMPLEQDAQVSVCVVGAGISGLTTAYMLAREGKSVIVLDDGPIAGGETGRTTAHLVNALDDRYAEIERMHGERGARLAAASHTAAVDKIEQIVRDEKIDCDFMRLDGYLFSPPGEEAEILEVELEAAQRAGVPGVELVRRVPLDTFNSGPALRFPNQAQFHPLKYVAALARAIVRDGGRICTRTHVEDIRDGELVEVRTSNGRTVRAHAAVVATNTPVNDLVTMHTKQAAYRTYVIGALIPRGSWPKILLWDTPDPYHYARMQPLSDRHDVLIVGGEDHKTGQADDTDARFDRLEAWTRSIFPRVEAVEFRWSGQVMEPADSLAFIGRNPGDRNVYIVTGDSGHGMTHGTIAGMLLTDLIQSRDNEWATLYDPGRRSGLRAAKEFVRENLNVAARYAEYLTGGDVGHVDDIPRGEGAVIRRGVQKIACFRDIDGTVRELSAVCPHLGCIVHWNTTEKTWDCPCHGSRFDSAGKVVNGPAIGDLPPVEDDESAPVLPAGVAPV